MSDRYCAVCEAESDLSYKCDRCGKPFDGDSDPSGEQKLWPDGGQDVYEIWEDRLEECAYRLADGLDADRLADRYQLTTREEIEQLTNRATLEMIDAGYSDLTLEEFDKAAERMEITIREVVSDGGSEAVDLDSLSTHDLVLEALFDLDDFETENGIHAIEIAEWVSDRTDVAAADVHDAISYLVNRGEVYPPAPGEERYRRRERDLRRCSS